MDKKKLARSQMIKKLAKEKSSDMSSIADALKSKKLSKVEVIAKDKKGLEEGLSKAQQILKAKLGESLMSEDEDESESVEEEVCEDCHGEGCPICELEEEKESEESEED